MFAFAFPIIFENALISSIKLAMTLQFLITLLIHLGRYVSGLSSSTVSLHTYILYVGLQCHWACGLSNTMARGETVDVKCNRLKKLSVIKQQ